MSMVQVKFNKKMYCPKISILMPVYNEEKYILKAVQSIIDQSELNFELIIIDDGSTDKTVDLILTNFCDKRIKIISNNHMGKVKAFNLAFKESKGKWIAFFAGDDMLPGNSLKNRLKAVEKYNPFNDLVASIGRLKIISTEKKYDGLVIPRKSFQVYGSGGTILFSRALAKRAFPIPSDLPNEDTWLGLHFKYLTNYINYINEIVLYYRIHKNNSVSTLDNFQIFNGKMHQRALAYKKFKQAYRKELTNNLIYEIEQYIYAEQLRYCGKWVKILFLSRITFKNKLRFIFKSNFYFYGIRKKFFRIFSGWGT